MKSKLGIYVIGTSDISLEWFRIAQPSLVVSMAHIPDFWRAVKQVSPDTFILGRLYSDNQPLDPDYWMNLIAPNAVVMAGIYDAWMSVNEPAIWNQADAEALRDFTAAWSERMHHAGFKTAAYSFSEGHPDLSLWPYLEHHNCDYLSLHEYDAPEMSRDQGWRCLRYRQPQIPKTVPILIGECGIDGGTINQPQQGWKRFGDEAHYLSSLKWYDSELQRDDYVIGAAIFAARWDTGGGSFDMADCLSIRDHIGSGVKDMFLTDIERAALIVKAGFPTPDIALAVSIAENGNGDPKSVFVNSTGTYVGSHDRGLWQINDRSHPEVSDDAAFDPEGSTNAAFDISKRGKDFREWSAFVKGTYQKQLPRAQAALLQVVTNIKQEIVKAAASYSWMPINTQAALYKFAQNKELGYPQTDEFVVTVYGVDYVGQVFNGGIVYVRKEDWADCHIAERK